MIQLGKTYSQEDIKAMKTRDLIIFKSELESFIKKAKTVGLGDLIVLGNVKEVISCRLGV